MTTPLSACCNAAIIVDDDPMEGRGAPIGSVSWSCSKCGKWAAKPPSSTPPIPHPASPLPWQTCADSNAGPAIAPQPPIVVAAATTIANAAARTDTGESR